MQLTDLLSADRVAKSERAPAGDFSKAHALATLFPVSSGKAPKLPADAVQRVLVEREQLQSTGIGEGVAIPHGAMAQSSNSARRCSSCRTGSIFERSTARR